MTIEWDLTNKHNLLLKEKVQKAIDETIHKEQQLLRQSRLAQMGEMIAMIAHQWRQPLNAISGMSSAIKLKASLNKLDNKNAIEFSDKITNYTLHLSQTIDDFRNFFREDKTKVSTSLDEIASGVLSIVEGLLKNRNITIIKKLSSDKELLTYENELKQVVLNLIKNAEDALIEKK